MPHKVNPIDFENAEGNLGIANAILGHLSEKLLISRLQRDLSDSTAMRNLGAGFAHSCLAYRSILRGLRKLELNTQQLKDDLSREWEILTEAVQTLMRTEGIENSYEKVKVLTRGARLDESSYAKLLDDLEISAPGRAKLVALRPANYVGLASEIASQVIERIRSDRNVKRT